LKTPVFSFVIAVLVLLTIATLSLFLGAVSISFSRIMQWVSGIDSSMLSEVERTILIQLRLPRVITACLVGASLGVAGVGFQSLFRNPLADPFVVGASSGAGLGVTLAVVLGLQASVYGLSGLAISAVAGSLIAVLIVFAIGTVGRGSSVLTLLLAGVAVSSLMNAIASLLMYLNDNSVVVILAWLMGSLAGNDWNAVLAAAIASAVGFGILWSMSRPMDLFLLGDSTSQALGLDLFRFKLLLVAGSSIATAAAVASAGIIGFVGLIAPHVAKRFVGPRHVWLLPMSGCVGASIMLVADLVARTIVKPAELPVGILTALLGCPFFLFLLKTRQSSPREGTKSAIFQEGTR
jgi:iron complex transport system permease protein